MGHRGPGRSDRHPAGGLVSDTHDRHGFDESLDVSVALERQAEFFAGTLVGAVGIRITSSAPGEATGEMPVGRHVMHPGGFVHGGAIATFGDSVAAWATMPALKKGWNFSTIQFQTNFMRAVNSGTLFGHAREVHRGSRTQVLDVRINLDADDGPVVATMTITQALLAPRT